MSRLKIEQNGSVNVAAEDTHVLGPIKLDLKSRDKFRFTGTVITGKATFKILGSLTENTYPGGGDWSEIRRFEASEIEGVALTEAEYPHIVIVASPTVEGLSTTVSAKIAHLVGGDVDDFDPLAVAAGDIPGKSVENILFFNPEVRGDWEDMWNIGGERIIHSTPAPAEVRSYDANDDVAGTGGQIAVIEGIVDNGGVYELGTEAVPLVGNGTATSVQNFAFLHRVTLSCGSNGTNIDDIEIFHGSNTDPQLRVMRDNGNITQASHFMVPDNHRGFIRNLSLFAGRNREVETEVLVRLTDLNDTWISSHPIGLFDDHMIQDAIALTPFDARTIFKVRSRNLTGGKARVSGRYTIILEELP